MLLILAMGVASACENSTVENQAIDEADTCEIITDTITPPQDNRTQTVIEAEDLEMYARDYKKLDIHLKDDAGNALKNKSISVSIHDVKFKRTTDNNGYVGVDIYYIPSNYTANITFEGDDDYLNSSRSVNVLVKKINVEANYFGKFITGNDGYLKISFINKDTSQRMVNEDVWIVINGIDYSARVDKDSYAFLPLNLSTGEYSAKIRFADSDSYRLINDVFDFNITNPPSMMEMSMTVLNSDGGILNIILSDYNGNRLKNRTVTVNLNGVPHNVTADANGEASLPFTLIDGICSANAVFEGDDEYEASFAAGAVIDVGKANITVTDKNISSVKKPKEKTRIIAKSKVFSAKTKNKKVKVTLKTIKGLKIRNAKLILKIKNKSYALTTNNKGVVTFKIKLLKKGSYNAKITYRDNAYYKAQTKTIKIRLK